jgi:hypothetical protein
MKGPFENVGNEFRKQQRGMNANKLRARPVKMEPVWHDKTRTRLPIPEAECHRAKSLIDTHSYNGLIGWSGIEEVARKLGIRPDVGMYSLFERLDNEHSGSLDFVRAFRVLYPQIQPQDLKKVLHEMQRLSTGPESLVTSDWMAKYDASHIEELISIYNLYVSQGNHGAKDMPPYCALPQAFAEHSEEGGTSEQAPKTLPPLVAANSIQHRRPSQAEPKSPVHSNPRSFRGAQKRGSVGQMAQIPSQPGSFRIELGSDKQESERLDVGITRAQLRACIPEESIPDDWIDEVFHSHDRDKDNHLSLEEFAAIMEDAYVQESHAKQELKLYFQ